MNQKTHKEITLLAPEDSFLVYEHEKEEFDFPIHYHPEFEINFIHKGAGCRRVVGDSVEEIGDLELVLVGPNLVHGWETHKCREKKVYEVTIQFHNDLFDQRMLSRRIFKPIKDMFNRSSHGILFSDKTALALKPRIIALSKVDSIDYFLELTSILKDLAISPHQRLLSSCRPHNSQFENSRQIEVVSNFIQQNFHRKITLAEISEQVNMSSVSFNRFIKKQTGKTFIEYINHTRISYAARLLIETDLSISEISFKCGFNNIAHFNQVFKKSKHRTPSEFRSKLQGIKRVF